MNLGPHSYMLFCPFIVKDKCIYKVRYSDLTHSLVVWLSFYPSRGGDIIISYTHRSTLMNMDVILLQNSSFPSILWNSVSYTFIPSNYSFLLSTKVCLQLKNTHHLLIRRYNANLTFSA